MGKSGDTILRSGAEESGSLSPRGKPDCGMSLRLRGASRGNPVHLLRVEMLWKKASWVAMTGA